uniref:Coat protein n=1 Tax=Conifer deltapartitivirus TaxID=2933097 RepID=A0A9C7GWL5_9VIRU|nr:putative coat protein [Conifer deltapartitivirus]CAI5383947.1 putative coat protein [Conifer deltapartitivirus]
MTSNPTESDVSGPGASSAASIQRPATPPSAPVSGRNPPFKTDVPRLPRAEPSAYEQATTDEVEIGNRQFEMMQYINGTIGHRFSRLQIKKTPQYIELSCYRMRNSIVHTIGAVMLRILYTRGVLESQEVIQRSQSMATIISNGTMLLLYKKLRNIHLTEFDHFERFARKPKVTDSIEVPVPYAYALQSLGKVKVNSLTTDLEIAPTFPRNETSFGMDATNSWSPDEHAQCIEYVKSLGIPCCTVNLGVKIGSAWWLMRQEQMDNTIRVSCPLPESNFTERAAVLSTLFTMGTNTPVANNVADLSSFGNDNYGIMLQNPPSGVNISTFHAIADTVPSVWQI